MRVRAAAPDDRVDAVRILDGALLEVTDVGAAIERGDVLVASVDGPDSGEPSDDRVVGVIVLEPHDEGEQTAEGAHVAAVAVNPSRRERGIGSALVEAARDRYDRLTADFRAEVEPFWTGLGFDVEERDGRLWGERT